LKFGLEGLCFLLAAAVNQPIVGIPTPREIRVGTRHPEIERIVEESVRQNWANHTLMVKKLIFASKEGEFTQPWVVSQFEI